MAEPTESEILRECAVALRKRERAIAGKYGIDKCLTYWDSDEWCAQMDGGSVVLRLPKRNNREILITSDINHKDPQGRLCVHGGHIVELQWSVPQTIDAILDAVEVFPGAQIGEFQSSGIEQMQGYCVDGDKAIAKAAIELVAAKITKPFEKLWKELGGEAAQKDDRLIKRVRYFWAVVERYKHNKTKWRAEMVKLGLIEDGKKKK